ATEDRSDRDPPGNGSFVKGDFGGFIALDLSRLLGGKRTTTALKLNQEVFGGDLGLSSDEVADNLGGLLSTVKIAPEAKLKRGDLRLRRIEDEAGDEIKGGTVVNIDPRSGDRLLFLPSGRYKWETRLGAGVIVRSQGEIVKDGDPGPSLTSDDPVIRIAIDVELAPPP
ncbi:MAG: hypothetical protein H7145_19975, partial [Akkermansiaceae bacterium]|nr:hypothetical protein [Armatimonadota bacterium]